MIDVTPTSLVGLTGGFNVKQWYLLPLALRQRWWRETGYGRATPSPELKQTISAALSAAKRD